MISNMFKKSPSILLIFTFLALIQDGRTNKSSSCQKSWIQLAQKCMKFSHSPRTYENAIRRCRDFDAQLATIDTRRRNEADQVNPSFIEEDPLTERESSSSTNSSIIAYLTNGVQEDRLQEYQSRQYYITNSSDLFEQYQKQLKVENLDSDLWIPFDDPSLASLINNIYKEPNSNVTFALVYSNHYLRWGIVPVAPIRKLSYICEGKLKDSKPIERPQSIEPKRQEPSDSPPRTLTVNYSFQPPQEAATDRVSSTTPIPDTSSLLFREYPQDQSIILGSTVEMRCSPLENESTLTWTFNGKNLPLSNRIRSNPNGNLRIDHVRNTDDGNYTCTIHSGGTSESKSARLEIIERPHQPEYITAELLDRLSTSVRVKWSSGFSGNSPIQKYLVEMRTVNSDNIDNEINALMLSNSWEPAKANISADQTSVIIPDLKPARKYIFRIKATNRVGTSDPSLPSRPPIEVPVQPPSMPPENVTGVPKSSTTIAVQWSPPPADSQNGLIKAYKIRHKLAGYTSESDWYTTDIPDIAHLTYILDDLIVWQNYEIQIAAENDKGVGPYSSSIYVRTKEGKPDKSPRGISAEAISSTSIRVSWTPPPPQHINGLNQGYKVQVWYDSHQTQLAKEVVVSHSTLSPIHTATIDGLSPYTDHYITVKCFTNAGDGPSNEEKIVVKTKQDLPEAVQTLEFADILDRSVKVVWKPPKRINGELDHYTLEYSESTSVDKKILKKFPAGTTEAQIFDLTPQTAYVFRIYSHTDVGQGPGKTSTITTRVPPVLPEPPANLIHSEVGPTFVTIQFDPGFDGNAGIEKWIAEALTPVRGEHPSRWQNVYISTNHTRGGNSVVIRNLKPFTRYKIRLTPANIVGPSRYPSEPTPEFQTAQIEPEQPPRDLSIDDIKSNSVVAHWSPLSNSMWLGNARGYNLTWSESGNSTMMHYLINDTKVDSCLIKDLEEYTEYSFRIYAINEVGSSPPSETVSVITLEDTPSSGPANLTAHAISSNAISVDWNNVPKRHKNGIIRGYKIQYQINKSDSPLQYKIVEDNSTRHVTLNDLKAYTTYNLAVAAYTAAGDGVYSTVLNVHTLEDTPGKPQNLSFPTVTQTSARILWDPPEEANGDIVGYKVSYHTFTEGSKEIASQELHQNERTFKVTNLKPDTHYVFTVTAKTKEGWGQQNSILVYTSDSSLRANLPFYKESWFVILCACLSVVITILITALLFVQTKSYKYKQSAMKSNSQDRLGDAGFSIDDEAGTHYNNGFGLLSNGASHRRSNGALSQSTANFTLPKTPPRPHPGSVVYSDEGDDDVFEDIVDKPAKSIAGTSHYDSSGDSLTEKPSEISSSTGPDSESGDDEYVNMANKHFVNHYANVNGTLRGQKVWKKSGKHYSSHRTKPKLPQRPAPSVPQVPGDQNSSSSDSAPMPGTSGMPRPSTSGSQIYGESHGNQTNIPSQTETNLRNGTTNSSQYDVTDGNNNNSESTKQNTHNDLLNSHIVNLNGGRIIVNNMAGSRAPLPGFTSFV